MDDLVLTVTPEKGLNRKGFVKTYTSNSVKITSVGEAFIEGANYTLKILKDGKQLFSGGAGKENLYLIRTLDEEDLDNCIPYLRALEQKRLTFDLELWCNGELKASGEIDVASRPFRDYIILEDGNDINIDTGILLNEETR